MELVTTHTHTEMSGHGTGSVEELVAAARAAHISTLAITEHYPLSYAFDPKEEYSVPARRMDEYCAAVLEQQARWNDIEIVLGCELDWLGAFEDRSFAADEFDRFALVLASVHFVDGWAFDDPNNVDRWQEMNVDEVWRRYFEVWCECASSDLPIDVMAHPDLVKKFNFRPAATPSALYREAAEAAQAAGRMIEVNTAGLRYPCRELYPGHDLLAEFCRAGVPCTVGTDAHSPADVARDIDRAYKAMYEAGYRELTVPCADGDRRTVPL